MEDNLPRITCFNSGLLLELVDAQNYKLNIGGRGSSTIVRLDFSHRSLVWSLVLSLDPSPQLKITTHSKKNTIFA